MRRHHVISTVCVIIALVAVGAAVIIEDPGGIPRAAALPAAPVAAAPPVTTTTLPTISTTALDGVWAFTNRPDTSCLMVQSGGRVLYERNPDVAVAPASTMKLVTAAAVLSALDPGERLTTRVVTATAPAGGVIDGDLWFVGGGDPVLGTAEWAAHFERQPRLYTPIEALADRIVAAGVREVRGRVVGDDSRYDGERYVASWPARYRADNEVGPLSALSVNDGFAVWNRRDALDVAWDDPPGAAAALLTTMLRGRGVVVGNEATAGRAPAVPVELASIASPTIGELVASMLTDSDNGTAELLVKELGLRRRGTGTTAAGIDAVRQSLAALGLPLSGLVLHDGSGLDHGDALTCRLLTAILTGAAGDGAIVGGLPVAAQSGTLATRFVGTPVAGRLRAKTGSITGVAALAGFADAADGRVVFAQVLNGIGSHRAAMAVQDALGAALVAP